MVAFPTGVAVITTSASAEHHMGITVNSFSSVSLDPPLVLWSLSRQAASFADFKNVPCGELTVTACGPGTGGRAQEFALAAALAIQGTPGVWVAGFGTDGRDGPTDAAGAVTDGATVASGKRKRMDAARCLHKHDSYSFFKKVGGHIKTGLTGTNVNDLYVLMVRNR